MLFFLQLQTSFRIEFTIWLKYLIMQGSNVKMLYLYYYQLLTWDQHVEQTKLKISVCSYHAGVAGLWPQVRVQLDFREIIINNDIMDSFHLTAFNGHFANSGFYLLNMS